MVQPVPTSLKQPHTVLPFATEVTVRPHALAELNVPPDTLSEDAWRAYHAAIQQFVQWLVTRKKTLTEADAKDLAAYVHHLRNDTHELRPGQTGRYAQATIYHKVAIVRQFYAQLHARGVIPTNPAAHLRIARHGANRCCPSHLSAEQVRELLAAPDVSRPIGIRDRAMLVLMALHGLRVGEVQRLNVADVNLSDSSLRVAGRCSKQRTVYLTQATCQVIEMWIRTRRLLDAGSTALFITLHWTSGRAEPGQRISTRGLRQAVDGYLQAISAKTKGISCQSLRKTYAMLGLEAGASVQDIVKSMGAGSALRRALSALADRVLND
jgi:integrase/recombinase XerD